MKDNRKILDSAVYLQYIQWNPGPSHLSPLVDHEYLTLLTSWPYKQSGVIFLVVHMTFVVKRHFS